MKDHRTETFTKTTKSGWRVSITIPHADEQLDLEDTKQVLAALEEFTDLFRSLVDTARKATG